MGAVHAEIEHKLKESRLFCFLKHFYVIVLEALYVHGAEVFAKNEITWISYVTFIQ